MILSRPELLYLTCISALRDQDDESLLRRRIFLVTGERETYRGERRYLLAAGVT